MQPPKIKIIGGNAPLNISEPNNTDRITASVENIVENDIDMPKGLHIEDHDTAVIDFFTNEFDFKSQGKIITVQAYGRQNFFNILSNWDKQDNENQLDLPLLAIIRNPKTSKGTNFGNTTVNIPNMPTFTLKRIPVTRNGKTYNQYIKIPQPVNIDIFYELHIITSVLYDVDNMSEKMLFLFKEGIKYLNVKGHSIKIKLTEDEDESETNTKSRKYYHVKYNLQLTGYIMDECTFEKIEELNQINFNLEQCFKPIACEFNEEFYNDDCQIVLKFSFSRKTNESDIVTLNKNVILTHDNQREGNYTLLKNGTEMGSVPFEVVIGDEIQIIKNNYLNRKSVIKIYGDIIE